MSLVTLVDIKEYLQITVTATDVLIASYIDITQSEIEAYLDRNLAQNTYTEVLEYPFSKFDRSDWTPMDALQEQPNYFLKNYPVTSFTLINGGNTVTSSSYTLNTGNGVLNTDGDYYKPTATYVAGYTTVTFPEALSSVLKQGVSSLFRNNSVARQGGGDIQSKKIKDFSVNYGNTQNSYLQVSNGQIIKTYLEANKFILNRFRNTDI